MPAASATPRFSILLPTHDRADVIGHSVSSALSQSEPDFELLVVCDGCTADTADVVRSFDDARIRLFALPKAPGFGWANRNTVLRQARGELVAFLGDDDLWLPDHLERFSDVFTDERVEWAYSRPLWMADDGLAVPIAVDLHRPDELERFLTIGNSIPATCVVHRRSALERYGYWPDELWQGERAPAIDWELWRRMVGPSAGANLEYVPVPTCIHYRASWRDPSAWTILSVRSWMQDARDAWWPEALKVEVGDSVTPQEATWGQLTTDPDGFTRRLRSAVVTVIDGFAWDAAAEQQRADALGAALADQTARADSLAQRADALGAALADQTACADSLAQRADALGAALADQTARADSLAQRADALGAALADQTARADEFERRLAEERAFSASLLSSTSWRAMAPARRAAHVLRIVTRSMKG